MVRWVSVGTSPLVYVFMYIHMDITCRADVDWAQFMLYKIMLCVCVYCMF